MYESYTYHPYNSLVPNIINLIFNKEIIPDDNTMFMSEYYIKPMKNETMNEYINRVPSDLRIENKIWGGWLYMIIMFLPLFIISILGLKVEKIDKEKIKRFMVYAKKYIHNNIR
jgi:hypothetical protein